MKETLDEAANDYATDKTKFRKEVLKEVDADNYVARHSDSMEDFQCGVEWQQKQSPWINVNKQLPTVGTVVLTKGAYGYRYQILTNNNINMSKGVIFKYKSKNGEMVKAVAFNKEQDSCFSDHGKVFLRILNDDFTFKKTEDGKDIISVKNGDELIQTGFWD